MNLLRCTCTRRQPNLQTPHIQSAVPLCRSTFAWLHLGSHTVTKKTGVTFNDAAPDFLKKEAPGGRYEDVTKFKHIVPYLSGQTVGNYHTWGDILTFQFSYEEFVFEYPDDYKTSYEDPPYRAAIHVALCLKDCAVIDIGLSYEALYPRLDAYADGVLNFLANAECTAVLPLVKSTLETQSVFAPCFD